MTPTEPGDQSVTAEVETGMFDPDPSDNIDTVIFEVVNPGTICGQKFEDLNGNGQKDAGEPGVNGVMINLFENGQNFVGFRPTHESDLNGDGEIDPESERGLYCFDQVPPAPYIVAENVPDGWSPSGGASFALNAVAIQAGEHVENVDFFNYRPGSISGRKWEDMNGDGFPDFLDEGIAGWTIVLEGTDGLGNAVSQTVTTDEQGNFHISNLAPGTYTVAEEQVEGWRPTDPASGMHTVEVTSGEDVEGIDFGNQIHAPKLELTKVADQASVTLGSEVTYTIEVHNTGNAPAEDVVITDFGFFLHLSALAFGENCALESDPISGLLGDENVRCDVGTLQPGESAVEEITYRLIGVLEPDANGVGIVENVAEARDAHGSQVATSSTIEGRPLVIDAKAANLVLEGGRKSATPFDIYIDSVRVFENVAAGSATPIVSHNLTARFEAVHVVPSSGNLDDSVLSDSVDMAVEHEGDIRFPTEFSFILTGSETQPRMHIVKDARATSTDPSMVELFVVHAISGSGSVDVRLIDDTHDHALLGTLVDDLPEDSVTDYLTLEPGLYNLEVASSGDGEVLDVYRVDLSERAGEAMMLALVGEGRTATLKTFDAAGSSTDGAVVTSADPLDTTPAAFALYDSYPNPFNPSTMIRFDLPERVRVRLTIFDTLGREVARPIDAETGPGSHEVSFDAKSLPSGLYLYQLEAGRFRDTRAMLLLR